MNVTHYHSVLSALDANGQHLFDILLTDYESSVLRTTLAQLRGIHDPSQMYIKLDEHTKQLTSRVISEGLMPFSTLARMSNIEEPTLTALLNGSESSLPLEQYELLQRVLYYLFKS